MTSERRRLANQANAKASTGPKTKAGKERSARNALRHGLTIPIWSDPALVSQAEAIALKIAGPFADAAMLEKARKIGEAQVELDRVRFLRAQATASILARPRSPDTPSLIRERVLHRTDPIPIRLTDQEAMGEALDREPLPSGEALAMNWADGTSELKRLDRYERRALAKRKFAIREFDELTAGRGR